MRTLLKFEFNTDDWGFGMRRLKKPEQRACEVIGVMVPCDTGWVVVRFDDDGSTREVPDCCLYNAPVIDYERLLTKAQKQQRAKIGFLFGTAIPEKQERTLLPLDKCPIKKETNCR